MEPAAGPAAAADHKSRVVLLALSRARDWLKALRKRQLEGLRDAQRSLDASLAVLLREEERLWARARAERVRLQRELATARAANEQAGRAAAATIQALQRRLGSLHTGLLAAPPQAAAPPRPAETAREAAALLAHAACLSVTLTRAHVVSQQPRAAAAALGELRLEEEVLSLGPTCKTPAAAAAAAARDTEGRRQSGSVLPEEAGSSSSWARGEGAQQPQGASRAHDVCLWRPLVLPGDHHRRLWAGLLEEERRGPSEGARSGPEGPGQAAAEQGTDWALPAAGKPVVASPLAGAAAGRGPLAAETPPEVAAAAAAAATTSCPGPPPPVAAATPLGPLVVQEGDSGSGGERGAARRPRDVAVQGSQGTPSPRDSSLRRWASAESLLLGTPSGAARPRTGTGSCVELPPPGLLQQAERGSATSPEALGSSSGGGDSHVLRGTQVGQEAAASIPPRQQQQSVLFPAGTPSSSAAAQQGWLLLPPQTQAAPAARSTKAPPPPCNRLVGQWGKRGSEQGQLRLPHGLHAATAAGCLYVVDFGNRRLQALGGAGGRRVLPLRGKAYFDVTVGRAGCLALTSSTGRCVELYSAGGVLLQAMHEGFRSPRGIATSPQGEFLVADTHLGALHVLEAQMTGGGQLVRRHTVLGFHKPYLVATNARGEVAVSERGLDGGCCVKVLLGPTWQVLRVLGGRSRPPVLTNPWGVSLDEAGRVLVADWGRHSHFILCYPPNGHGWAVATHGLSSPRGLALLGERHIVVADSMHHCLKTFQYC